MKIRTWQYFIKEGVRNVLRNRVMSLASISAIIAALFVLGIVVIAVLNLNNIADGIESQVEVTIFLDDGVSQEEIEYMGEDIKSWTGIYEVEFISKAMALENWKQELGDRSDLMEGYGPDNNPLPNSFIIKVEKPEYVEGVVERASSISFVERVNYSKEVVEYIGKITSATRIVGIIIVCVLALISLIIINNTIKLTVYSRRKEIGIMKYVGATDWYIRWPFVIEGLVLGVTGALVSLGIISFLYSYIEKRNSGTEIDDGFMSMFRLLPMDVIFNSIMLIFLITGSVVGVTASAVTIRKYLKV